MINSQELLNKINETRVLVLIESPDWKGFQQVRLNSEQFFKVSYAIASGTLLGGNVGKVNLKVGDKVLKPEQFERMASYYEKP